MHERDTLSGGKGDVGGGWGPRTGWSLYMKKKSCRGGWKEQGNDRYRVEARRCSRVRVESE